MEFIIEQFDNNFKLSKKGDSRKILSGNWSMLIGKYKAEIFNEKEKLIYSINRKFSFWKWNMSYSIKENIGNIIELKAENKWHSLYKMKIQKNEYVLKLHKGRRKSIFKNGIQIAKIDESLIEVFYKDKVKIITNNAENINEIFLLIICLKIGEKNEDGITFDLGNFGKLESIDNNWKPEKQSTNYNTV
jgi:hypothetical protein